MSKVELIYWKPFLSFDIIKEWKGIQRFKYAKFCNWDKDWFYIHFIGGAGRFMENVRK